MSWLGVKGADRAADALRESWRLGRFPHALLFAGPEGVGKKTLARGLAQAILCEARPALSLVACGLCPSCVQVIGESHPDLMEVKRPDDKQELPVQVVRELCDWFGLKPMRGPGKVAIVDDADDLTTEASNAFLKTLEEPPPGAVLVLISTSIEVLLPTILSRCQVVRFDPLPLAVVAELLLERGLAGGLGEATRLAALGEGSASRSILLADPEFARFRRGLIDLLGGEHGFAPPELAARTLAFLRQAGKEAVEQRRRGVLVAGELARFFRGVLETGLGLEPPCPLPEDAPPRDALALELEPEDAIALVERCLRAEYELERRLYLPLVVESFMHDVGVVLNRGREIVPTAVAE